MAVQVDIGLHRAADLGTARLDRLAIDLAARGAARFLGLAAADKTFVEHDLAAMRDGNVDLAALRLCRILMLP